MIKIRSFLLLPLFCFISHAQAQEEWDDMYFFETDKPKIIQASFEDNIEKNVPVNKFINPEFKSGETLSPTSFVYYEPLISSPPVLNTYRSNFNYYNPGYTNSWFNPYNNQALRYNNINFFYTNSISLLFGFSNLPLAYTFGYNPFYQRFNPYIYNYCNYYNPYITPVREVRTNRVRYANTARPRRGVKSTISNSKLKNRNSGNSRSRRQTINRKTQKTNISHRPTYKNRSSSTQLRRTNAPSSNRQRSTNKSSSTTRRKR